MLQVAAANAAGLRSAETPSASVTAVNMARDRRTAWRIFLTPLVRSNGETDRDLRDQQPLYIAGETTIDGDHGDQRARQAGHDRERQADGLRCNQPEPHRRHGQPDSEADRQRGP